MLVVFASCMYYFNDPMDCQNQWIVDQLIFLNFSGYIGKSYVSVVIYLRVEVNNGV